MALDKQDLKEIKKIVTDIVVDSVNGVEKRLGNKIEKVEQRLDDKIEFLIEKSKDEIIASTDQKIKESENRVISRIDQEISDTSEINRKQFEGLEDHEHRIVRLEKQANVIR